MSNGLTRFPDNVPPKEHYIWWDEDTEQWRVWFNMDEPPMYKNGDYESFDAKLYKFKMVEEDCDKADCGNPKCENCNEASGFGGK